MAKEGEATALRPEQRTRIWDVLQEVAVERERQHARWGEQDCKDVVWARNAAAACAAYGLPDEATARAACQEAFREGAGTCAHLLVEEVSEAIAAAHDGPAALRKELVQVAAVATQWIEAIDRRLARAAVAAMEGGERGQE